jgi:hypothetical protein
MVISVTPLLAILGFLVVLAALIYTFLRWRCPNCNKHLGKEIHPRRCPGCGVSFRENRLIYGSSETEPSNSRNE